MNERLLQFIWQNQYFNKNDLRVTSGKQLGILHPGTFNSDQGPDFSDARIMIDENLWAGNVELHINSSDWKRHQHDSDGNYKNVVLHVVWKDDETMPFNEIPVFELGGRVPKTLMAKYESWMYADVSFIPCSTQIGSLNASVFEAWYRKLIYQRLAGRSVIIEQKLKENRFHWDQVFWCLLVRNFGIRVNADAFEHIAKKLPLNLLIKHKNQIHQLEAMLLGQAGLLEQKFSEKYPILLQKEYRFYRKKYALKPIHMPIHFLRMRPVNFPTVRLAQLAMFLHTTPGFFAFARDCADPEQLRKILTVTANDFWHYHYRFEEVSQFQPKQTGKDIIDNIFINTLVPIFFAYGSINHLPHFNEKAIQWLETISTETNPIIRSFRQAGIFSKSAYQSQALLELKRQYCDQRKCLECMIGKSLLNQNTHSVTAASDLHDTGSIRMKR